MISRGIDYKIHEGIEKLQFRF